ncbi:MAG: peroxiredoxin [Candidatus Micrarchaeota archaeon]|nr:peroxiredoxin [Candidatus Micrarchaeota archaeon]
MEEEFFGMPLIGDRFPRLEVKTTKGKLVLPDDMEGKWFVLFSHPADFTPVCTTEFIAFQEKYPEFKNLNTELIGLSIDQIYSHHKWLEWIKEKMGVKIEFPVIADDLGMVAETLGMIHPGKGPTTVRAVFIVDDKGIIRAILYYPQEIGRNINEILRTIKALQTSDREGVATPANWPENERFGDKKIVPPPTTEEEIEERKQREAMGEIECFDWWLCLKK